MEMFSLVTELGKCLYVPLKRHCCYVFRYDKNVNELKDEAESLRTRRDDTNRQLAEEESRSQRLPLRAVENWKTEVEKVVGDVERLTEQASTEEHKCLMGWCPNFCWRYRLGKSAAEKLDQVKKLENRRVDLGVSLTCAAPPPAIVEIRGDDIVRNEVAATVMEQVTEALEDDSIRSIGIYGMGGIGKTTLVRNINNRMKEFTVFNKVIMVTVSQNPELKTIQDHIAERLGMDLQNSEINSRADQLLKGLKKQESVLIILDDIWTELKIVQLGLPRKNEHDCCKIILTTRIKGVCHQMGTDAEFEMTPLSEDDSWDLFKSKTGDVILKNPNLLPFGKDIVNECKGSPLAIVTLGSTLAKKEEQYVWQDAVRRLRSSEPTELDGIMPSVISAIKVSYDYLRDEGMKFCFLFCSLFPEDSNISLWVLRIFGIGEGFLHVEGDLLQAKVKLRSYIRSLKDCGLLLDVDKEEKYVKMHDVVRDTARYIASKEGHGFIERTRKGLTEWPKLENEKHCKRLSLMDNYDLEALPDSPKFPQLRSLFLRHCHAIKLIPNNFFLGMSTLVNLDLAETTLEMLPLSISSLTSLRTLKLGSPFVLADKWDMSSLRMLKNLEILILYKRVNVPIELVELTNLKVLSLPDVQLEEIPKNVFSKLHRLEELYLKTYISFSIREGNGGDRGASLAEVVSLKCLTVLHVTVREEETLSPNNSNNWSQLQEFWIVFGNNFPRDYNYGDGNSLGLGKLPSPVPEWVICLIRKVEYLQLEWRPDLKNVLQLDTVSTLKYLTISNCSVIQHIANTEEAPLSDYALGRLKGLRLVRLSSLEKICQGPLPERFVMNLKFLEVEGCNNLRYLLSLGLAQQLRNLVRLEVGSCERLEKLISDEEETAGWTTKEDVLPRLKYLTLRDLRELTSLYNGESFLQFPSLKRIKVIRCSKLKQLSLEPSTSPKLKEICGEEDWLRGLEQEMHMEMKSHFQPLFRETPTLKRRYRVEEPEE